MSGYYKPHRNSRWNYSGPNWRLSRSKIELFNNCPRCFYIDNRLGTTRPPGFPFNLNSAVDVLLKKEFDVHRSAQTPHPLMVQYDIDAVPFAHTMLDEWRENFKGVAVQHESTGMTVCGAVDDVWVNPKGELVVVDYKSTSKAGTIDALDQEWQGSYKCQMDVYQWLLRTAGFTVSNTGYFVYANALTSKEMFNKRLDFDVTLIRYDGNDSWVEPTLLRIKQCLDDPRVPKAAPDCDYCTYRQVVGEALLKNKEERAASTKESSATARQKAQKDKTLF